MYLNTLLVQEESAYLHDDNNKEICYEGICNMKEINNQGRKILP